MGIDDAITALGTHPLRQQIVNKFNELATSVPSTIGFTKVDPTHLPSRYQANSQVSIGMVQKSCAYFVRGFDGASGAINYLSFDSGASSWASQDNRLLWLEYQTYSQADFTNFMETYNYLSYLYEYDDYYDYDKVGIDAGGKTSKRFMSHF